MKILAEYLIAAGAKPVRARLWLPHVQAACDRWGITSGKRVAAFLAQAGHESLGFSKTVENLNYSETGLKRVFGKYFTPDEIGTFARKPVKIANRVYSNRMGNGPEDSGDGWAFRGRGLFQLTGRANVLRFSVDYFGDDRLVTDPGRLEEPELAAMSAGHFWYIKALNALADRDEFRTISIRINGGVMGLDDRIQKWNDVKTIMNNNNLQGTT